MEAPSARHALAGMPRELPETYTRHLPHMHVDHQNGAEVSISNGTMKYIREED